MASIKRREKSEYEKALEKYIALNVNDQEEKKRRQEVQRQEQAAIAKQNQLNEYENLQGAYGETLRKWGNRQGTTVEQGPGLGRLAVMNAYGDLQNRYNSLSGTGGVMLPGKTQVQTDRNAAFMASDYGQALNQLLQRQSIPNYIEQTMIGRMQREKGQEYTGSRAAYNELRASYQRPPEGYANHDEAYRVMMGDDRDSSFAGVFGTDYKAKQRERERLRDYYGQRGAMDTMEGAWNGNAAWMTDEGLDKITNAYELLVGESREKDEERAMTGEALDKAYGGIMSGQNSPREANELVYDIYQNGKSGQASVEALTDISRVYLGIESPDISDQETYRESYAIYEKILSDPEGVIRENNEAAEKKQEKAVGRYKQAETAWNKPYTSKTEAYNQALENLEKEQARRSTRRTLEDEARADETFEEKSQGTGKSSYMDDFLSQSAMDRMLRREDDSVLANYINSDDYSEEYESVHSSDGGSDYWMKGYDMLTDEEKQYYNYFYNTQGAEKAKEYLEAISSDLLRRRAEMQEDRQTTLAENPIMGPVSSAVAIPLNMVNGVVMTGAQMIGAMKSDTDTNSALYDNNRAINTIRQTRGQVWAESPLGNWTIPFINANAGELGYQTLMSMADNAMALSVAGKLASGTKGITALTQGIMSSEAASGALTENLSKGMEPGQAVVMAGLSGVIEAATEKYSIEALLSNPKSLLSYVAKNAFTEGTEEVASTLLNTAADELAAKITGNRSEIQRQYNDLLLQNPGMSQQEATRRVLTDYLQGMGADFLGGALSGAAMSGGRAVQTQVQRSAIGNDINMTKSGSQLLQVAEAMEDGSESRTLAEKLRARETQGKKLSNGAVGQLYQALYTELDEKGRETVRQVMEDSVEERLMELGESQETAKAIAPLMMRVASGEQISRGERSQIAGATYGTRVLNELRFADEETHSSQWARESNEKAESAKGELLAPMWAFERQRDTARAMGRQTEAQERQTVKEAREKARTLTAEGMEKTRPNRVSMETVDEDGRRGEVLRMVENRDGGLDVVVKHAEGTEETVPYDSRTYSGGVAHIISYANMSGERMTAKKADLMLHSYTGGDAGTYIQGYNRVYNAGYDGRAMPTNVGLLEKQAKVIYDQARRDGQEAENRRKAQTGQGERRGKGRVRLSADVNEKTLTEGQRTSIAALSAIARQTGVHFEVFASKADAEGNYDPVNGWYDRRTNTIHIDVNSGKNRVGDVAEYAILRTASHELTHFMENNSKEGYAALKTFITNELERKGLDFDALVQRKQDRSNVRLTHEDAVAEVIADGCEMMLQDSQAIERLAKEDKSLFQKVKGFVENFLRKIKAAFSGVEAQSIEARTLADMREGARRYAEELQKLWDDALVEAAKTTRQVKVEVTVDKGEKVPQYSLREYSEHQKENWKDSKLINIYENDEQLRAFVERALSDRSYKGKMYFGQVSEELARAIYDATGVGTEGLNLALYSDEVVKIIKDHGNEKTEMLRGQVAINEEDFRAIKEIVERPDKIKLSDKLYEGHKAIEFVKERKGRTTVVTYVVSSKHDLRVQTMYKGKEKKSLASVKDANASLNAPQRADTSMTSRGTALNNSISQTVEENNPRKQFSMREPVEERTDGLIAVHNMKSGELLKTLEELGGFPSPSIAVVRARDGHSKYGDVSVVFGKETIDPQANRQNKVYSQDAWTPEFPEVMWEIDTEAYERMEKRWKASAAKLPGWIGEELRRFIYRYTEDVTGESMEEMAEKAKGNSAVKAIYLNEQGRMVKERMMEEKEAFGYDTAKADLYQKLIDHYGEELNWMGRAGGNDVLGKWLDDLKEQLPGNDDVTMTSRVKEKMKLLTPVREALRYKNRSSEGTGKMVVDRMGTVSAMDEEISQNEADYDAWLRNELKGILGTKGVRNEKEMFTPSGNRRDFRQLYDDYTLENIVKAMNRAGKKNATGFGPGNIMAASAREFSSIDEIRRRKDQLRKMSEEEYKDAKEALENEWEKAAGAVARAAERKLKESMSAYDLEELAKEVLLGGAERNLSDDRLKSELNKEGFRVGEEAVRSIREVFTKAENMPTGYFEAKPMRAVGMDEVKAVILPESADEQITERLAQKGVNVVHYDGTEADRLVKLNQVENVQFSLREQETAVREYMSGLKEEDMPTKTEREILKRYHTLLERYREAQQKAEEARNGNEGQQREAGRVLRVAEQELKNYERKGGAASLMRRSQQVVNRYLLGKTRDQVESALGEIRRELGELREELARAGQEVERSREAAKNAMARSAFQEADIRRAVRELRESYGSGISMNELGNRLAIFWGELTAGKLTTVETLKELARDIVNSDRMNERGDAMQRIHDALGGRLTLTEGQRNELKALGIGYRELQSGIKGVLKYHQGGVTLDEVWAELTEYVPELDVNASEGDQIIQLLDVIERDRALKKQDRMLGMTEEEAVNQVMIDIIDRTPQPAVDSADRKTTAALRRALENQTTRSERLQERISVAEEKLRRAESRAGQAERNNASETGMAEQALAYYAALEEQRRLEELAKQKEELTLQLNSASTQKLLAMQEQYEKRLTTERAKRNLTADNAAKRRQIGRLVKSMDKKIRMERENNHVLEAYKPVVEEMVKTFADTESNAAFTRGEAIGISRVYAIMLEMDGREDIDVDPDILDDLEEIKVLLGQDVGLSKAQGARTEIEKLQERNTILTNLAEVVQHFNKIVNDAGTAFVDGKRQKIDTLAEGAAEEMWQRKPRWEMAGNAGRVMRTADNALGTGNITPYYFFKRMGNSVMDHLWQDIRRGQNKYGLRLAEAREAVRDIKSRYNYDSWKNAEPLTFTTVQGRTITMDAETAMQLYATWRRETQTPMVTSTHLENGGFVYGEENRPTEGKIIKRQTGQQSGNRLTQADMNTITKWLTEDMKKYADAMVDYLSTTVGEWGNETSMEQAGIRKYKEGYYIPMEVAGDALRKGSNEGATDPENSGKNKAKPAKVSRPGFSKTRVQNASKPLVMRGLTQVAERHINGMLTYSSFAIPIESMNSVLNAKTATKDASETTLRQVLRETYGRNWQAYLETLLRDLNGGAVTDPAERAWNKLTSLFKKGAVYGSLSVAAQQPLSYIRAATVMNPKYLAEAMAKRDAGYFSGAYEEAKRYSGVAVIKEVGRIDMGMGMSAVEYLDSDPDVQMDKFAAMMEGAKRSLGAKGYEQFKEQWNNTLGYLPGKMDEITWGRLWTACKLETAEKNPMLDTKSVAFMEKVAERFNDVIDATQVYDSTLSRSQNMRSNTGMMNMLTSFMAEPTQTLNMLIYAFTNQEGGKGQRIGSRAAAITIYALGALAQAAVKGGFTGGRKDDEEKTFLEKWAAGFASNAVSELNPLGLIPGVRDMVSLLEGSDVDRADLSVLNELITAGSRLTSDKYTTWRKVEDFGGAIAKLAGVPLKNVMRDIRTMGNWFGMPWAAGNADRPTNANVVRESVTSQFKNYISAEGLGLVPYETSNTAYYDRYYRALKEENKEKAEYFRDYLTLGLGVSENAINSGLKAQVKTRVLSGELSKEEAIAWLVKQGLSGTEKKAFNLVDGWIKKAGHEEDEEYKYSAYNGVMEAVLENNSQGVKEATAEMLAMGYEQKEISSAIRSGIGEKYGNGEIDRAKAEKLLKAYGDMDSVKTYGADAENEDKVYWTLKKYGSGEEDFSRYNELYAAVDQNSAAGVQAATRELTAHGSDADEVKSKIRSYIGSQFKAGQFTEAQANSLMKTFGGMADKDDLYWQMRQWKAEKANENVKGYEYGKYDDFHQAVETGRNLAAVIREYTEHGIEAKTLASQITKEYKERFVSLYKTDMTAAANLQARLLTAYEALGYNRGKKHKDIQKWLRDED